MIKQLATAAVSSFLLASSAHATFTAEDFISDTGYSSASEGAGYYVWTNSDLTTWNVYVGGESRQWQGKGIVDGNSVPSVASSTGLNITPTSTNSIEFAVTSPNNQWSGFSFELAPTYVGTLQLELTSNNPILDAFVGSSDSVNVDALGENAKIFFDISLNLPDFNNPGGSTLISEPASVALFSLGLIGLGVARRKAK